MRIISGSAKGRRVKAPKGMELRPTSDRVKESLFNIIREKVKGSRFLDLFSGTGNVGVEALSRGASKVTFVEKDHRFFKTIIENLSNLGLEPSGEVILLGASEYLKKAGREGRRFDIIFIDPPYQSDILDKDIFPLLEEFEILAPGGIVIIEHFFKKKLQSAIGRIMLYREYRYGDTVLTLYTMCNTYKA